MNTFSIGSHNFEYGIQQGTILQIDEKLETVVSGGGGGGYIDHNGQGRIGAINISSHTINHQTLYLVDQDGKQFSVKLENWNIKAIKGHHITLLWIKKNGPFAGQYIRLRNNSLDLIYTAEQTIMNIFKSEGDQDWKAFWILYGAALIGIPCIAYSMTRSDMIGTIAFLIMAIGVGLHWQNRNRKKTKSQHDAMKLYNKSVTLVP